MISQAEALAEKTEGMRIPHDVLPKFIRRRTRQIRSFPYYWLMICVRQA